MRVFRPIDPRGLARELGREGGAGLVLGDGRGRRIALLEQRQRLDQCLRAHLGEMCRQLTTGDVRIDVMGELM